MAHSKTRELHVTPREALLELARRKARRSLRNFILYTFKDFEMGWFHEEVCNTLDQFMQDVIAKKSPRVIITAPPRHGKSQVVSRDFPAYFLGRNPDKSVIACSYGDELAKRMNRDVQRIMDSEAYQQLFEVYLAGRAASEITGDYSAYSRTTGLLEIVAHAGSYRSTGVGGGITGQGCDVLIIDDPIKDKEEAYSEAIRDKIYDWYTSTARTRVSPGGGIIVMCTRWHLDDLVGRLLQAGQDNPNASPWRVINYPAIAERDEPHRKLGEALHPARYTLAMLEEIRAEVGERDWASMFQQRPMPAGGGTFKLDWIQYYETLPPYWDKIVLSWDMAFKDNKDNDFVVGACWGRYGSSIYLVDQIRGRWDFVTTKRMFIDFANKHSKVIRKLIEDKANGPSIISSLKDSIPGIIAINPKESKESRASAVATTWEAHNVYIPSPRIAPWVGTFVDELVTFPACAHDDQVDAMSQAISDLVQGGNITPENMMMLRRR